MNTAVLLVGHGTKNPAGRAEFMAFADLAAHRLRRLQAGRSLLISPVYLELAEPGIAAGVASCLSRGVSRIVVVPLMLFAAGHVKRDIPDAVHTAAAAATGCRVEFLDAVEADEVFARVALARLVESGYRVQSRAKQAVVFVTRGSRDVEAQRKRAAFAALLQRIAGATHLHACGLTGGGPSLEDALAQCEAVGQQEIFLIPYLLFHGALTAETVKRAFAWQSSSSGAKAHIAVARHLGPDPQLAWRLADRIAGRLWRSQGRRRSLSAIGVRAFASGTSSG